MGKSGVSKWILSLIAVGRLASWLSLWLFWDACWPRSAVKNNTKRTSSKTEVSAILVLLGRLWGATQDHFKQFWGLTWKLKLSVHLPRHSAHLKTIPNSSSDHFWSNFWGHFQARINTQIHEKQIRYRDRFARELAFRP